jgi:5-methyltetrahydropteroyltriglutamate--homocysteine methyltransferase
LISAQSRGIVPYSDHAVDDKRVSRCGVIDIKDNKVETPDEVARRIERAARFLGPERIVFVHPDCGLWMLPRSVADAKMRALVAGRDLFDHGGAA